MSTSSSNTTTLPIEATLECRPATRVRVISVLLATVFALASSPAWALDSIDLSAQPMAAAAVDEAEADSACPALTRIKYPWIQCTVTADGNLRMTGAPNSRAAGHSCRLHLNDGRCAATAELWRPYFRGLQPPAPTM
jgi:hypothetical protein